MPLTLTNLDDRRYAGLVEEALALIPTYAPEWTNHNPSDPGITLIELFAYLTEMLIYRLNRVTDDNIRSFLKLLNEPQWQPSGSTREALAEDLRATILALQKRHRAVSCEDFEILTREADTRIARVRCISRRNLLMNYEAERPGSITMVVVPRKEYESDPIIISEIIKKVEGDLELRRLLTTRVHVVGPVYLQVRIQTKIMPLPDQPLPDEPGADIADRVVDAIKEFLHPLPLREGEEGWPFGRNVFVSEIYEVIERVSGVDYVASVDLMTDDPARLIKSEKGELIGIEVMPYELVLAEITRDKVTSPKEQVYDRRFERNQ